jgi:hypothetical protein
MRRCWSSQQSERNSVAAALKADPQPLALGGENLRGGAERGEAAFAQEQNFRAHG